MNPDNLSTDVLSSVPPDAEALPKSSKRKYFILGILAAIVLVGGIGVGGLVLGMQKKAVVSPSSNVVATPTVDPAPDWKLYTDPNNRFTFKYPKDWEAIVVTGSGFVVVAPPEIAPQVKAAIGSSGSCIPFYPITISQPFETDLGLSDDSQTTITTKATIVGFPANIYDITYKKSQCVFMGTKEKVVTLKTKNNTYRIDLLNADNPTYKEVFDKLLTTLKFNDVLVPTAFVYPSTSEDTYKDKDFEYSISYPVGWIFRQTYGKNISKGAPTDILSGFDLTYNTYIKGQQFTQATIVVNVLDGHSLSDIQTWISQYDLNYPKNASKMTGIFNGFPAIIYVQADDGTGRENEYIYFLARKYAYRISFWEKAGISSTTHNIVYSFQP